MPRAPRRHLIGGEPRGRAACRVAGGGGGFPASSGTGGRRGAGRARPPLLFEALPKRSRLGRARPGRAWPQPAPTIPPLPSRCRRPPAATMQELIASVDHIKFDLELAVEQQLGAQPLPFPGMDSACGLRARPFLSGVPLSLSRGGGGVPGPCAGLPSSCPLSSCCPTRFCRVLRVYSL